MPTGSCSGDRSAPHPHAMRPHALVAGLFLLLAASGARGTITTTCSAPMPGQRLVYCTSSGPCEDFVTTKLGRAAYTF